MSLPRLGVWERILFSRFITPPMDFSPSSPGSGIYPYQDRIPKVQKLLNLPGEVMPLNIIPVGCPAEKKMRENLYDASRVHTNKW